MRVLIALDINDEDLEADDCTFDDVEEGLRARLSEFYPGAGETRATLYSVGDVTESFGFLMDAIEVGMEGPLSAPEDYGTTSRIVDEAEVALIRLTRNENTDADGHMPPNDAVSNGRWTLRVGDADAVRGDEEIPPNDALSSGRFKIISVTDVD